MIRICGLQFHEDEKINPSDILRCHPQLTHGGEELLGIPLRVTVGFQCIYDKVYREYQGVTFYAPVHFSRLRSENNMEHNGKPLENLSYVLASYDGTLTKYKDGVCLVSDERTLIYSNLNVLKSSGTIKKGGIIGTVKLVDHEYGYGVTLRGYKGGKIWNIPNDIMNIPCIE